MKYQPVFAGYRANILDDRDECVRVAFDEACQALPDQPPSDNIRDILAKRITELAQYGEWDYARLRDQALEYLKDADLKTA